MTKKSQSKQNRKFSKVVLVTGASSGIGREIAQHLAAGGHTVFGTSRSAHPGFDGPGGRVQMLQMDIMDEGSVQRALQQIEANTSGLSVLVNNAGNGIAGAIEDCSDEELRWQMETNYFGTLNVIRAALPLMRKRGKGKVITLSSIGGNVGLPYQGAYCASKFALEGINEALRFELVGSGIQSTVICPGDFKTGFTAARKMSAAAESEVHASQFHKTLAIYERDEQQGASPELIGRLALQLVKKRKLAPRYFVGRFDQKIAVTLKRFLPAGCFEWLARKAFGISAKGGK